MARTKIEYSEKTAKFMSKQERNRCILEDFNVMVTLKRIFPNLMDVYNQLGKVYNLSAISIAGIIRTETEYRRVMKIAQAMH